MKKYFVTIVDLFMRIVGGLALAYAFGILLWIVGTVFYDIRVNIFDLWIGVIAAICYFLLFLLKRYLK